MPQKEIKEIFKNESSFLSLSPLVVGRKTLVVAGLMTPPPPELRW